MTLYLIRPVRCSNGECSHPQVSIVRQRFANNTIHLTRQCSVCGHQIGQWIKADLYMPDTPPWFDEDRRQEWEDRRQLRLPL